ncbi:nucleotide exchange factor GrpE [Leptothoe sp. PORK10 BA2]|uniref:nucleotide exchange factor GrpE n=1 Tax=Leptothoe sp. PORK10 BA2 TaxID=3110254 RepID=UPI002B20F945|nr:nucleotide exchange factor GrpE [Leptothoe sp. PORK10 BA2]MEA5465080.1 nucleotide exchange factor GrpE [Leptothoe sp. PORK10 BA2]
MTQSPRDRIAQRRQLQKQQSQIFLELLPVLDDLDRACSHWQQAQQQCQIQQAAAEQATSEGWWQTLISWWVTRPGANHHSPLPTAELSSTVESAYEGVFLIRQSLLEILERQAVTPIETLGHPFDPREMSAIGREPSAAQPANTVIKEIIKGYRWQDRVLREAQVIVAEATDQASSASLTSSSL